MIIKDISAYFDVMMSLADRWDPLRIDEDFSSYRECEGGHEFRFDIFKGLDIHEVGHVGIATIELYDEYGRDCIFESQDTFGLDIDPELRNECFELFAKFEAELLEARIPFFPQYQFSGKNRNINAEVNHRLRRKLHLSILETSMIQKELDLLDEERRLYYPEFCLPRIDL